MSIKSMTSYGFGEHFAGKVSYRCEIKTLNSRFVDVSVRLPRFLISMESKVISEVKNHLTRGKVDVFFDVVTSDQDFRFPTLSKAALEYYFNLVSSIHEMIDKSPMRELIKSISVYELLKMEGVLVDACPQKPDTLSSLHEEGILLSLRSALEKVQTCRAIEGNELKISLRENLTSFNSDLKEISARASDIQKKLFSVYRQRLENLLSNLAETGTIIKQALPEDRLLAEVAVLTDKSDINEEITRL
ncbi:MAG: hypothetical protein HQK54_03315, partial [Oligoflexales bacterium]|nr:hypothetical protein [Oligoflexales bacterium]